MLNYKSIQWSTWSTYRQPQASRTGYSCRVISTPFYAAEANELLPMVSRIDSKGILLRIRSIDQQNFWQRFSNKLIRTIHRSSFKWFGKELSLEEICDGIELPCNEHGNIIYIRHDSNNCTHFNGDGKKYDGCINVGDVVLPLLKYTGIWFKGETIGVVLSATSLLIIPTKDE